MNWHRLISFLISISACRGSNTTFKWTSDTHITTTPSTHGDIGDYVAAGLGIDARKSSSTVAATENSEEPVPGLGVSAEEGSSVLATIETARPNRTQVIDSSDRKWSQSSVSTVNTTTAHIITPSGPVQIATDGNNVTTTTDCWDSWLDYWSASSLNKATYETSFYSPETWTKTEIREEDTLIPTSTWESYVDTATYSTLSTIYSDGYPVSVAVSYETRTYSHVGWDVFTIWSSLYEFHTTFTQTYSMFNYITTTRSTTALPTPQCELPAAASQCSKQWGSYISTSSWKYYDLLGDPSHGSFPGTPDCTQVMITGDWCTSMASFYFARETMYGQVEDVGWLTEESTTYFPASKSLAPGCSLGCQACSITGETVQLYYWPPSTATLVENGTETATLTPFAQDGSGVRTVSIDGTTLTSPTMYISYDILHAANSCGAVGKTYRNTILPLLNTNHLFSLEPIVAFHGYASGFITSSFNLADLIEPIPESIYGKQRRCKEAEIYYNVHISNNGFSCARTEPYAPIIGVPPEVRALDPEWASCNAWYGGLYDPPKALQPAEAIAVPTLPAVATSPAATPQSGVDSRLPVETLAPTTGPPKPETTQSKHISPPAHSSPASGSGKPNEGSGSMAPVVEETTAGPVNEAQNPVVPKPDANSQSDKWNGISAIISIFLPKGSQPSDSVEHPSRPSGNPIPHIDNGVVFSGDSEVHTALSSQGSFVLDGTPLTDGQTTIISGQTINVESGTMFINGVPQHHSVLERPPAPQGPFAGTDQEHTGVHRPSNAAPADGESYALGAVTAVDDPVITVAPGDATAWTSPSTHTESPGQGKHDTIFIINGHTYSVESESASLRINGAPASAGSEITTNGDVLTIGSHAIVVEGATIAFTDGKAGKPVASAGAEIFIAGGSITAIRDGDDVLVAGTKLTLGQIATISGTQISVASDGIVVGSSTATFHDLGSAPVEMGDALTTSPSYPASGILDQPTATAGASAIINGEALTALRYGADVILAGRLLTLGQVTTISGSRISVASDGVVIGSSTAAFSAMDGTTANAGIAVAIDGTVYSASTITSQPNALLFAGQTLREGGTAATINGQVLTNGPNGISFVKPTASAKSAAHLAETVIIIDGTAYTVTPVAGVSGAVVLQGHTLYIGGSDMTIADHLITKGSNGISVASATSSSSAATSESPSSTEVSDSSTTQQISSVPSDESAASVLSYGLGMNALSLVVLFAIVMSL